MSVHRRTLDDGGFESAVDLPSGWFMSGGPRKEFKLTDDRTEHADVPRECGSSPRWRSRAATAG